MDDMFISPNRPQNKNTGPAPSGDSQTDSTLAPGQVLIPGGTSSPPAPKADAPQPKSKPKRHFKKLLVILLLASFLVGLGYGAYWYVNSLVKEVDNNQEFVKQEVDNVTVATMERPINNAYPRLNGNAIEIDYGIQMYEGLVAFEDGATIRPALASHWSRPDDQTWLFTLKDNVKFHSGRVLTPEDVVATWEAVKNEHPGRTYGQSIKAVEKAADNQVRITTNGPDPILLNRLAFIWIIDTTSPQTNGFYAGTGAYRLKEGTVPTETRLELVAFDDYHGGRPLTRSLTFVVEPDEESMVAAVKEGRAAIGLNVLDESALKELPANLTGFFYSYVEVTHIGLNHRKAGTPLAKLQVRQALLYATDPEALLAARGLKGGEASQIIPKVIPGYNPDIKRPARDVNKARALLAEAGHPNGITLEFAYSADAQDAADELKRQLAEAGIILRLDRLEDADELTAKILDGRTETYFATASSTLFDLSDVFAARGALPNYSNAAVAAIMANANTTFDEQKRLELMRQASTNLMEDVMWVPLYTRDIANIIKASLVVERDHPGHALGVHFKDVYTKLWRARTPPQ